MSGKRLLYTVAVVLLVTAIGRAGYIFWDWKTSGQRTQELLIAAQQLAAAELLSCFYSNYKLATETAANIDFDKAFAIRDRASLGKAVVSCAEQGRTATVVLKDDWQVFFSSALPEKQESWKVDPIDIPLIEKALSFKFPPGPQNPFPCGLCALWQPDGFSVSSFVPLKEKDATIAVLAVSSPFGSQLLNSIEQKFRQAKIKENTVGVAFYIMQGAKITASSAELQESKSPYLSNLTKVLSDPFGDKSSFVETEGRLWKNLPIWGPDGQHAMGQIILCTALANPVILDPIAIVALIAAIIVFFVARNSN